MRAAQLGRLFGFAIVTLVLTVAHSPARAQQCGSSCARGRSVCMMQTRTTAGACLQSCAAGDRQCHAACITAMHTARSGCQTSRSACTTTCPGIPAGTTAPCIGGCSGTAKQCFANAFTAGTTCVQGCKATGGAGLMSCLLQCAETIGKSAQTCIAAFQTCLSGCPVPTPPAQCSSVPCQGQCVMGLTCTPGEPCPEFVRLGQCETDASGACGCVPVTPPPTRTPRPTPTPQCTAAMCGGTCTIDLPFPCPDDATCNGPNIPVLVGQCKTTAVGCECVPVKPTPSTPRPTPTPQCTGACGGPCQIVPICLPGLVCPADLVVLAGECTTNSAGVCECLPVIPPTPTPGCTTDADCNDGNVCTADRCVNGVCEHGCICLTSSGEACCGGPSDLCVAPCGTDAAGSCGGSCPVGAACESGSSANAACECVSGPGGPCGGNILAPPPVCAAGLVCHQTLPDITGYCEKPDCVPLFTAGCTETADCCQPCENGTHAPCGVCINGTCDGAP